MRFFYIYIAIFSLLLSCKQNKNKHISNEHKVVKQNAETKRPSLPTMPVEMRNYLATHTTSVEGTMYTNSGSFSLTDKKSAKDFIQFLKDEAPRSLIKNQVGHIMLLENGEQLILLTVFMKDNIIYTKYTDTKKSKSYYNILTGQPAAMFQNIKIQSK